MNRLEAMLVLTSVVSGCDQTVEFVRGAVGTDGGGTGSDDGPAPGCGCAAGGEPWCGADGRTYPNACALACAEAPAACAGQCPCDCVCTMQFDPVCGADGVTYQNQCALDCVGTRLSCAGECPCGVGDPCGGIASLPCPAGFECLDDRSDACDPGLGADCPGLCAPKPCGNGAAQGPPCPEGYTCVDDPTDGCDPITGGDCPGHCEPS